MRLSAPGNVTDFITDQQRSSWSLHLSEEIDSAIADISSCAPTAQYVNPATVDVSAFNRTPISWPGFPKLLYSKYTTRAQAYAAADMPMTVQDQHVRGGRVLQDEYLEWFIHRDAQGDIRAVDFTTETQEYWTHLYTLSKELAVQTYSAILGESVSVQDISNPANQYNPYNKFNTTDGIIHLIQPNNTLPAELDIAAQSTLPRIDASGSPTNNVVSCAHCTSAGALGEAGRNSDPTIAQQVNAVAGTGCFLTVPDPVGLYIQKLDLAGWTAPPGVNVVDCWKIIRGNPAVRARFTVPDKVKLSDFSIGGLPLQYAGQIAEKIQVFLTAAYGPPKAVALPPARPCAASHSVTALDALALVGPFRTRAAR